MHALATASMPGNYIGIAVCNEGCFSCLCPKLLVPIHGVGQFKRPESRFQALAILVIEAQHSKAMDTHLRSHGLPVHDKEGTVIVSQGCAVGAVCLVPMCQDLVRKWASCQTGEWGL